MAKDRIKLNDLEKRNFYKAPEGFFDSMDEKIFNKIEANNSKPRLLNPKSLLKIAASFILIAVASFFFTRNSEVDVIAEQKSTELISEVSAEELISYMETHYASNEILYNEVANLAFNKKKELDISDKELYNELNEYDLNEVLEEL